MFNNFFFSKIVLFREHRSTRQATDDNKMGRMHSSFCIRKPGDTRSECIRLIAVPPQHWLRERALVSRYTYLYIARLVANRSVILNILRNPWLLLSASRYSASVNFSYQMSQFVCSVLTGHTSDNFIQSSLQI
jgi:hypothetical protein